MAAVQPSLLMKHFKPDWSYAGGTAPRRQWVRSGLALNDSNLQQAAYDAWNYFSRASADQSKGAGSRN
jgi:hypothetical protein